MGTATVFQLSEAVQVDGAVVGSAWTDDHCRELLRALRLVQVAAPDDPGDSDSDVAVTARIFHEVLELHPASRRWPVLSGGRIQPSLYKRAVMHAADGDDPGIAALLRVDEEEALLAANVARWMLQLPQQSSLTLVFVTPPASSHHHLPRPRHESREAAVA